MNHGYQLMNQQLATRVWTAQSRTRSGWRNFTCGTLTLILSLWTLSGVAAELPLAGVWQLELDSKDEGVASRIWERPLTDSIQLPGTTALAGKGEPLAIPINLERPAMQSLHQRFRYVGPAWYQRTVKVPSDWKDQEIGRAHV